MLQSLRTHFWWIGFETCQCRDAGGAHFPWWAGVILGVGLALIVAAVLLTLAVCYVCRLQRRNSELASSVRDVESKVSSTSTVRLVLWANQLG